jgi:tetratricopeptide (TPR) repeat protein
MLGPSRTPPTDLFDERFTNRVDEIRHFVGLLDLPETELVKIHFYRGVTGAGKSHLLTKFEKLCRERSVGVLRIDLDPERQGTPTIDRAALAARLVHAWELSAPRTRHALMRIALIESQALWSQSELAKELGSQAAGVSSDVLLKNWDSFSIGGFVAAGVKTAIGAAKEWRSPLQKFLRSDEGKADELYFRGNPTAEDIREDLFRRLGLDFQEHPAGERQNRAVRAALLIDSLEKASGSHDWIWDIYQNFAEANGVPRLLVLGAGQTVPLLPPAAAGYDETVFLDGFPDSDARQYIEEKRRIGPARTGEILAAALESGEPVRYHVFSLGLSCDTVLLDPSTNLNDLGTAGQLAEDELKDGYTRELAVVNRFMRAISEPLRQRYLRRLALTPVWDDDAAGFAFERYAPDQREDILDWLAPFSFITRRGDGTSVMHGAIRRCLLATNDPDDTARWHAEWAEYWRVRSGEEDGGTSEAYWHHRLLMPDGLDVWKAVTKARRLSVRMQDHAALVDRLESHLEAIDRAKDELAWASAWFTFGTEAQQVTVGPDRLRAAEWAYRNAMTVYTRESMPADWAGTQNNLGNVLQTLGERTNDAELLQQAVAACRKALEVLTREAFPSNWAMTQNNLGNVLHTLGARTNDAELLRQAVAAYRSALEVLTREALPAKWAATQNNLGNVLHTLGQRTNDMDLLQQAVNAQRGALEVHRREAHYPNWAATQNSLGLVLQTLGEVRVRGDAERLQQAVAAFRSALRVLTRESMPTQWAMTQNNLGNVLQTLVERTNDAELLQQAVAAYESALEVITREALPAYWATVQTGLGTALGTLGKRTNDAELLQAAVAAYGSALEVRTRESMPADWATTQHNLGKVLLTFATNDSKPEFAEEAATAFRGAWEVYEAGGQTHYAQYFADRIAAAEELAVRLSLPAE